MHHIKLAMHTEKMNRVTCSCELNKYYTRGVDAERCVSNHAKEFAPAIIERTMNGEVVIPPANSARPGRANGSGYSRASE